MWAAQLRIAADETLAYARASQLNARDVRRTTTWRLDLLMTHGRFLLLLTLCAGCASNSGTPVGHSVSTVEPDHGEERPTQGGEPQSETASVEALKRDCNIENPEPCFKLCEMSIATGCYTAGLGFQKRPPQTRDDARSLAAYQRGCDLGSMESCGNLGLMFEKGRGTSADPKRARDLYEKVCAAGVPVHCRNVGRLCEGDAGFPPDAQCAADAYARALRIALDQCSAGTAEGCAVAGFMYRDGKGTPVDENSARELLSKACSSGYKWACAPDPYP